MSNEITHNTESGLTLYACRFQKDGDVFITDGSSDEEWGTAGHDADTYDVTMTEEGTSGHYKGDFDTSSNIGAGVYDVVVREQIGAAPSDNDQNIAQGEIYWDGTAEINPYTISAQMDTAQTDLDIITGTNGVLIDDDAITSDKFDELTAFPVEKADTGATEIARTGADGDTLETLSDQLDAVQTTADAIEANTGKVVYGSVYSSAGVKKVISDGSTTGFVEDEKL